MPYRLDTHVLAVDANVIHKVDTGDPANLYSMWTDSVEQGRRLENLSWRLWQRETFVVDNEEKTAPATQTLPQNIPSGSKILDLPQLSGSVESLVDEEAVDLTRLSASREVARARVRRQDSCASTRNKREHHISSDDFEKMIVTIIEDKGPLSASPPVAKESLPIAPAEPPEFTTPESQSPASEVSPQPSPQRIPRTTVVRGFTVGSQILDADRSSTEPAPKSSPAVKAVQPMKPACPTLGGSCLFVDQNQSLSNIPLLKKPNFSYWVALATCNEVDKDGLTKSVMASSPTGSDLSAPREQNPSSNNVKTLTIDDEAAVDSNTDDYVDENTIDDDDDSSDWEDSTEESGRSSMDDKFFQQVDSKPNLTSRRSLITLMLTQNDRARNLGTHASNYTLASPQSLLVSPDDSDEAPLMMKGMLGPGLKPIHEVPRSGVQPIITGPQHIQAQAALSPRTTRHSMLTTELPEYLLLHLAWERQEKLLTVNAVLKRQQHTSHDVATLKQYSEKPCMKKSENVNASSWKQYFSKRASDGYRSKGG